MRIHVADLARIEAGIGDRHLHRPGGARTGGIGLGHVRGVRRHSVADQLRVDLGAACLRVLQLLEYKHAGGLAHHQAVAGVVERPRCALRVVVAARERTHRIEARDADLRDRRLAAAGDHRVDAPHPDLIERVSDRHVRRRAGGALAHQRALGAELDRDPARTHVRDDAGDRERADSIGAAFAKHVVAILKRTQAADTGRNRGADPLGVGADVEARVLVGLPRSRKHDLREAVHAPCRLPVDPHRRVEVLQLAGEMDWIVRGVEQRDLVHARLARKQCLPGCVDAEAKRADHADAGDHHPPAPVAVRSHLPTSPVRRRRAVPRP